MENKSLILVTKKILWEQQFCVFIWTGCDLQWLSEASGSIVETCFIFPFIVAKEQRFLDDQRAIYFSIEICLFSAK